MDQTDLNKITVLLYQMNYDHVRTTKDENYLCIAKMAEVLKSNGFTLDDFFIPLRNATKYTKDDLIPIWNTASNSSTIPIQYLYDMITTPEKVKRTNSIIYLDSIEETEVEWLIPNYIPKNTITLISGDGGVGKGFMTCNIIKRITTNEPTIFEDKDLFTPIQSSSRRVLYFTSEDSISSVIKKRLRLAGVDQSRVGTILVTDQDFVNLKYDSPLLEDYIIDEEPVLVIFDPFQAFIDSKVNLSSRGQVREVMNHLIRLGELYGTTFILISHTNKSDKRSGRGRIADSADIWDIARSVFIVGKTTDESIRYFSNEKNNYCEEQPTTLFSIVDGAVHFEDTTQYKDDYYSSKLDRNDDSSKNTKVSNCKDDILDLLSNNNGEIPSKELSKRLSKEYSEATIKRAKDELAKEKHIEYSNHQLLPNGKRGSIIRLVVVQTTFN